MASKKMYFDLHLHTSRHSGCSVLPAAELLKTAAQRNLDGLVITEHSYLWSRDELDELLLQAGSPPLVLLSGCEVRVELDSSLLADMIVFGCPEVPKSELHVDDLCRWVHEQGGVVVAPHPFAQGRGICEEIFMAQIDAIELYNCRYQSPRMWDQARKAWEQLGITSTGGSDSHDLSTIGNCCTEFDVKIETIEDVVEAIRDNQCRGLPIRPPASRKRSFLRF